MKNKIETLTFKFITIIMFLSVFICGCSPVKVSKNNSNDKLTFNGLDDPKLQEYMIESLYSGINAGFDSEDYEVVDITANYVSKEYIDALTHNTSSNIYFGYDIKELDKQFKGKKYVFDVDENNKTIVREFEDYRNVYIDVVKNVTIGTGVIVFCVTMSSVVTGTMYTTILMASAKTGVTVATSSAAFEGVISSAVELYKTGDVVESLEKGILDASNSFKWGAIAGVTTGGFYESINQYSKGKKFLSLSSTGKGVLGENKALKKYKGETQVVFSNGKRVNNSVSGSTRVDILRTLKNGKLEGVEVKNYNLDNKNSRINLVKQLKKQITNRVQNMPEGSYQRIVLDTNGRNYDKNMIKDLIKEIQDACSGAYKNIPVDVI